MGRERRHKQVLADFEAKIRFWKFKEEAQDCTVWRITTGRGYGLVAGQTT